MKRSILAVLAWTACSGVAFAQSPTAADDARGYVEVVGQSAFGNVTSQSFGGEIGFRIKPGVQVYVEGGHVSDTTPASLSASAQAIAADITAKAGGGGYSVRQPVTFGVVGIKYLFPVDQSTFAPYVMVGGGAARVEKDVNFTVPSGQVSDYVTIGTDLAGNETKGMLSVGVGVEWALGRVFILDLQYRYGRVFTSEGLNINRAGAGFGVRF